MDNLVWRQVLLSKLGPKLPNHRLVALVIESYMGPGNPVAWPSQETIADRVRLTDRQVRRILAKLDEQGWICRREDKRGGQRWRLTTYSPSIPASLRDAVPVKREDIQMSSAPPATAVAIAERSAVTTGHPELNDRTSGAEGADISRQKVRTFGVDDRTSGCPTNSPSELSIGTLHVNVPCETDTNGQMVTVERDPPSKIREMVLRLRDEKKLTNAQIAWQLRSMANLTAAQVAEIK